MRKIGFTGRRTELTELQLQRLELVIMGNGFDNDFEPAEFHHGDCVEADLAAAKLAKKYNWRVVTHPPIRESLRAYFPDSDETREPKEFIERNHNIVDETDRLIACPDGPERMRSGTWATIRYALKTGKPVTIIWPDSTVEYRHQ